MPWEAGTSCTGLTDSVSLALQQSEFSPSVSPAPKRATFNNATGQMNSSSSSAANIIGCDDDIEGIEEGTGSMVYDGSEFQSFLSILDDDVKSPAKGARNNALR
jgi:hypothetical protein